jgi:hypothetical protein
MAVCASGWRNRAVLDKVRSGKGKGKVKQKKRMAQKRKTSIIQQESVGGLDRMFHR